MMGRTNTTFLSKKCQSSWASDLDHGVNKSCSLANWPVGHITGHIVIFRLIKVLMFLVAFRDDIN